MEISAPNDLHAVVTDWNVSVAIVDSFFVALPKEVEVEVLVLLDISYEIWPAVFLAVAPAVVLAVEHSPAPSALAVASAAYAWT